MSPAERDRDVLTSLPNARPTRRSAKRAPRAGADAAEEVAKPAAPRKAAPRKKPAAAAKSAAAAKPKAVAKPKATAKPKPKAAAPRTPRAAAKPKPAPAAAKPSSPPPPPAGWATPGPEHRHDGSTGDLIGTAVQAVGELAQIGLTYGGQALRQAFSRLPRP